MRFIKIRYFIFLLTAHITHIFQTFMRENHSKKEKNENAPINIMAHRQGKSIP